MWAVGVFLWLMAGLCGSALAINSSRWLRWRDEWPVGVILALLGPINFAAGCVMMLIYRRERDD